jgi:hypothetical protein
MVAGALALAAILIVWRLRHERSTAPARESRRFPRDAQRG